MPAIELKVRLTGESESHAHVTVFDAQERGAGAIILARDVWDALCGDEVIVGPGDTLTVTMSPTGAVEGGPAPMPGRSARAAGEDEG